MGIDPQTHKPVSQLSDNAHLAHQNDQKSRQQQSPPSPSPSPSRALEEHDKETVIDETDVMDLLVDGFCTEEDVSLIEPLREVGVPCASSSSSTTSTPSSSTPSSSSSFCSHSESAANLLQDLVNEFPEFEWPNICENGLVDELLEDELGDWDFIIDNS